MFKTLFTAICWLGLLQSSAAHEEDTENPQSVVLSQSESTRAKVGRRGPPGPPGTVNYTRIHENLQVKYEEFEAGIAEKMKEFQTQIKESLTNNEELLNNRTNELRDVEAKLEAKMATFESMIGESLTSNEEKLNRCNAQLLELEEKIADIQKSPYQKDCDDICTRNINGEIANQPIGFAEKGSQAKIFSASFPAGLEVYCECTSGDEAWMVFQRRMDGSQDFYQNWQSYVNGFGSKTGEFWLGLDALSKLASNPNEFELRIDLMDWENEMRFAEYSSFSIGDASTNYKLTVDGYSGTAGDSLIDNPSDRVHNQMAFSVYDEDNDSDSGSCAEYWHGAWWFNKCFRSHLNGKYYREDETRRSGDGIIWHDWKGYDHSLKATEMKMRKKN